MIANPQGAPIAIIGGGAIGSAIAYYLTQMAPEQPVVVVERDPSYAQASSALSASSIRQQFSSPINIAISQFGIEFLRDIGARLQVHGEQPDIGMVEAGYLYLASPVGEAVLRDNHAVQRGMGADVALLAPDALRARFPWLSTDGVSLGSLGLSSEGWFDGYSLLQALRRKAQAQGVRYVQAEAVGVDTQASGGVQHISALRLADGQRLECSAVVNAAGAWARPVAQWLGIDLPVFAKRRTVFHFSCPEALPHCPLLIDPSGIWLRPEGAGFIAGYAPAEDADPDDAPLDPDHAAFENHVWPQLAARIPAFEALRLHSSWAGYYEMNAFDHNAILGLHPACDNLYFANGFSGHGLQQCPAVGRGLAELILTGRWQTLDLEPLAFQRLLDNRPLLERNVI
ncbi:MULTISPECIES: FAD-binding oxidoreductase [unclassified Simplicispira]|uniref:NAD(P)/FAD-dependent oxidoreductase n=1 Tax=unclassified Simplicispira TaxID=2630407 RepID=UPI000D5C4C96|nr:MULTISPECIES: FAD-binding oxidoreductase [unclassified Simplicispira]PVY58077.1 glycine/D-amino acid oxidase-like deaminating enzyme [Simplicispira sp. 125]REG19021.1 glycine/D-amino acid oxidase-like deaminating enzyme [Simplicispira sp. 110]